MSDQPLAATQRVLGPRDAIWVDGFRTVSGGWLALHFATADSGVARLLTLPAVACIIAGRWPRLAALFLLCLTSAARDGTAGSFETYVVSLSLLWLWLLPTGSTLQLNRAISSARHGTLSLTLRRWCRTTVSGDTVALYAAQAVILYASGALWRPVGGAPRWMSFAPAAFALIPILHLAAGRALWWLALCAQSACHAMLVAYGASIVGHGLLLASALLFRALLVTPSNARAPITFTARGAVAATYLIVMSIAMANALLGGEQTDSRAGWALAQGGLAPPQRATAQPER